jgi:hypothetical protein
MWYDDKNWKIGRGFTMVNNIFVPIITAFLAAIVVWISVIIVKKKRP